MNKYNDGQYTIGDYIIWVGGVANYFSDYDKAIKITDVNELGDVMISQLSGLFENKNKLH